MSGSQNPCGFGMSVHLFFSWPAYTLRSDLFFVSIFLMLATLLSLALSHQLPHLSRNDSARDWIFHLLNPFPMIVCHLSHTHGVLVTKIFRFGWIVRSIDQLWIALHNVNFPITLTYCPVSFGTFAPVDVGVVLFCFPVSSGRRLLP